LDFTFDEIQQDVAKLAGDIIGPRATLDRLKGVEESSDGIDRELWAELAKADLLGIALPEEVGGSGHGIMELGVVLEEVGRRVVQIPLTSTVGLTALTLAGYGSEGQRELLRAVIAGEEILTTALMERGQLDVRQPEVAATKDGDGWKLDGLKLCVPHAPLASRVLVSAATPDGPGLFLVDPSAPGVVLEPIRSTHREVQAHVLLEGARVSASDVVGPLDGEPLRYLYRHALACMCAISVGVLEEAVRITASYISERKQFDRPIATFQGATMKAADAYMDAEAVRATTWSAIWRLSEGRPADEELAIAKFWVADGGQRAVHACQHLHGGIGVDTDYPIHRYFLWAKELELALGGTTPQLLDIGSRISGAPFDKEATRVH
jgi:3-oxocholest-4-en-26-oyl-CoA dehydrogenase beta subunit